MDGDDCLVYTEEFLPGRELASLINRTSLPSAIEIRHLLSCLVQAIRALWTAQNTVHRDIKPGNIFATGLAGRPYVLLDLGIAYNVKEPGLTARPDCIPATPRYMAPEMLDPNFRENLSYRADLYATGVTAFEFATGGTHPLARTADDLVRTITRILHQDVAGLPHVCALLETSVGAPLVGMVAGIFIRQAQEQHFGHMPR